MSCVLQVGFIQANARKRTCTIKCEKQHLANQIVIFTVDCFVLFYFIFFLFIIDRVASRLGHGFREESKTPGFRTLKERGQLQERLSPYQKRSLRCHLLHGVCRFFFPPLLIPFFFSFMRDFFFFFGRYFQRESFLLCLLGEKM